MKSDFAILDVKAGRKALAKHFAKRRARLGGPGPEELRIPVTIIGYLVDTWSNDDGTSQEFSVEVVDVEAGDPGDTVRMNRR